MSRRLINLQALIDREILIDSMNQNFIRGESFTELSVQLWHLICEQDIQKASEEQLAPIPERLEDWKKDVQGDYKGEFDALSKLSGSIADSYADPFSSFLPDKRFRRQVATSVKLQMIVSCLCGYFDEVVVLERMRQRNEVGAMFRNILDYIYKSHLTLCVVVNAKIPDQAKKSNVRLLENLTFRFRNGQYFCKRSLMSTSRAAS